MTGPTTSPEFDRTYKGWITPWGDVRIPPELKALAIGREGQSSLELGCGLGRFSRWLAGQGLRATGADFSPVAIGKACARGRGLTGLRYQVSDVTSLPDFGSPFDMAFDVGCFHCLPSKGQRARAASLAAHLHPGAPLLIWALDATPAGQRPDAASIAKLMGPYFTLQIAKASRRRLVASHWDHLRRNA